MPQKFPSNVYAQPVPGKGTGLFTSQTIPAGELVFAIERPLVQVPDNKHLAKACYNCFYLEPPEGRSAVEARTLKACNGCKIVKYCSKVRARVPSYCGQPSSVTMFAINGVLENRPCMTTDYQSLFLIAFSLA